MIIYEKLIKYNFSKRSKPDNIKYIVIHDTANKNKGANANAHFNFFNGGDRGRSAHYFVDDTQALRIIKDSDRSWAIGDGGGKYGITNDNSISIEICVNIDGDFSKTYKNTIDLVKYLMDKYKLPIDKVVRHYDASRKLCPESLRSNDWAKWKQFKLDLQNVDKELIDYKPVITKLYNNIFERDPDSEGLQFWNKKLNEGLTFGDFLKAMGESQEFEQKYLN